jgi:hypothetical protein
MGAYNLVAVQGLSGLGQSEQVQCTAGGCCMSRELYDARQAAYNEAVRELSETRGRMILAGVIGVAGGALIGYLIGRS